MESVIDLAGTKKYCLAITCKQARTFDREVGVGGSYNDK